MLSREKILESLLDLSGRSATRSRPELIGMVLRSAMVLTESAGSVAMLSPGRQPERYALRTGLGEPEIVTLDRIGSDGTRPMLFQGKPVLVGDVSAAGRIGPDEGCPGVEAGPAVYVPLRLRDQSPGYLAVFRKRGAKPFDTEDVRLITLLAAWTAVALENLRLAQNVEKLAVTDDLTQVYNYRFLKSALRREIKRAGRYHQDLSLLMVDVDNLKNYNDQHGHLRGSFLLREMAGLFSAHVRSWDLVAKYGGDEFTVILPQTDAGAARALAEKLRRIIEDHTYLQEEGINARLGASVGIATYPLEAGSKEALIRLADERMYADKDTRGSGR